MDGEHTDQVSREEYLQGIAISTAVFCLPSLLRELTWLNGLVPLPVFYYFVRFGKKHASSLISISVVGAVLISAVLGSFSTLIFSLTMAPVGFILARSAYRQEPVNKAGLKAIAYLVLLGLAQAGVFSFIHQVNPYTEIAKAFDQGLQAYSQYLENAELPDSTFREIDSELKKWRQFVAKMFPALISTSILFTVWANIVLGNWLLKKKRPSSAPWGSLREWNPPESLVWIVVLALLGMLLPSQSFNTVAFNMALVLGVLYFFQGVAVFSSLFAKWSVPPFFRLFIYTLMIVLGDGIILLALIGLADTWADFRKLRTETEKNNIRKE